MDKYVYALVGMLVFGNVLAGNNSDSDASFSEKLSKLEIPAKYELSEVVIGDKDAPISVAIYTSFTCTHCRKFHQNVLPRFKKLYVDTGKVKLYFRSYLDDVGALESALLTRCLEIDQNKIEMVYNTIYSRQKDWLNSRDPRKFLKQIFIDMKYSADDVEKCTNNRKISAGLMKEQQRATLDFKISSIPAFVINGKLRHEGSITCEKLWEMCVDAFNE